MNKKEVAAKDLASIKENDRISYRDVSVETLREFYTDQIESSSIKEVAARAGLGRTTFQSFLTGSKPYLRTHRALAMYYLHAQETGPREEALRVLAGDDHELQSTLLRAISDHLDRRGRPVPLWVRRLMGTTRVVP
jgi:hypothetical protein